MGFVIEKQLTNARPPKVNVAQLITTPTNGNMRLTEKSCELLGVKAGDYLGVVQGSIDGRTAVFIHKGWADEKEGNVGSKLASPNKKTGGSLLFSSAYAYQQLGGNDEVNKVYAVSETPMEDNGVKFYELTFEKDVPKQERTSDEEEEEAVAAQ
jgi:hypothetical protein